MRSGENSILEPGDLWVHPDYEAAFSSLGWTSTDILLHASLDGTLGRRRDYRLRRGWDNVKLEIPSTSSATPRSFVFMKRHRTFWHWRDSAIHEAEAALRCQSASVPCMKVVACGIARHPIPDGQGRWYLSLFMSEPIGNGISALAAIRQTLSRGEQGRQELLKLMDAVARTVAGMHSAHVYHGDCHLGNFMLADQDSGAPCVRIIDLQSSLLGPSPLAYRAWLRDMCLVRSWWIRLGVPLDDLNYWYERYNHWATGGHIQQWMVHGGRQIIAVRGDLEILRRGLSRFPRFQFARGCEILRERYRAA